MDRVIIHALGDAPMLLAAMVLGVARWEFFTGSTRDGEVCVDGLRYSTRLNAVGCPELTSAIRSALWKALEKSQ